MFDSNITSKRSRNHKNNQKLEIIIAITCIYECGCYNYLYFMHEKMILNWNSFRAKLIQWKLSKFHCNTTKKRAFSFYDLLFFCLLTPKFVAIELKNDRIKYSKVKFMRVTISNWLPLTQLQKSLTFHKIMHAEKFTEKMITLS